MNRWALADPLDGDRQAPAAAIPLAGPMERPPPAMVQSAALVGEDRPGPRAPAAAWAVRALQSEAAREAQRVRLGSRHRWGEAVAVRAASPLAPEASPLRE